MHQFLLFLVATVVLGVVGVVGIYVKFLAVLCSLFGCCVKIAAGSVYERMAIPTIRRLSARKG